MTTQVPFTMIPFTESCGNYARVPPINNIHSTYHIQPNHSNGSSSTYPSSENTVCSRRGRRSNVPPEIREQTRRLKKQNMERRRRACISDKMNALHNLAMNLIGIDPNKYHKVEKADILNLCQSVFEGITNIAKDEPEFQERLRKLRYNLNEISNSSSITSTTTTTLSSSPSLCTSTNNSTSNVNEDIKDIVNVNGKGNSLRKFTRHPHHHRSYHQSQQHSHSTTTISSSTMTTTTTTQMFGTPKISSRLPTCDNFDQKIDEDDKENRIPRLIIRNTSSIGHCSTPYLNNVIINNTCNSTPIASHVTYSSSSSSFSASTSASFSSSVTSTPVNNLHTRVDGLMMKWQSTPLQYNDKYNSLLSDSDSGFCSSGIQSVGFTPNANNVVGVSGTNMSMDSVQSTDLCSVKLPNIDQRSCNVFMSCMRNMSSVSPSSLSCDDHLSAFSVPVRRSGIVEMNKSVDLHSTNVQHVKLDNAVMNDSMSCTRGLISSSPEVASETINTKHPVMWRPYLD